MRLADGIWRRDRLIIAAAVFLILLIVRAFPIWYDLSNRGFDLLSTVGQPVPAEPGIIIVAIDEPSFSEVGLQWPWPRGIHAQLIESLRRAGVRAIGFDVVFAEGGGMDDAALVAASADDIVFAADEMLSENAQSEMLVRTEPLPALIEAGGVSGVVSIPLDGDGVARRIPRYSDAFSRQLLRIAGHDETRGGGDRIQFFGPENSYPRISYYQALDPGRFLPPNILQDAVVIVGYNLQASPNVGKDGVDAFESPYTVRTKRLMPGPEIHATIYDNLMHNLSITDEPTWLALITLLAATIAGFAASLPQNLIRKAALALGMFAAILGISWLTLRFGRLWVSPAEPILAIAFTVTAIGARDFAAEQRRRREVQLAFSQYVSPAMVEKLVADPTLLKLGGERKPLTILFADIRGFTTISEAMKDNPEALVQLINDILTPLTDIVIEHGGTIDKYIGDCIMAFWNAPLDDPDHAHHAISAARAMIAAMPLINENLAARVPMLDGTRASIAIGIGVNTGECVVGNMGSHQRFDYSVLGDPVNTASRLEGMSKVYGVPIVVGETTVLACDSQSSFVPLGETTLKGKLQAIEVFTI